MNVQCILGQGWEGQRTSVQSGSGYFSPKNSVGGNSAVLPHSCRSLVFFNAFNTPTPVLVDRSIFSTGSVMEHPFPPTQLLRSRVRSTMKLMKPKHQGPQSQRDPKGYHSPHCLNFLCKIIQYINCNHNLRCSGYIKKKSVVFCHGITPLKMITVVTQLLVAKGPHNCSNFRAPKMWVCHSSL